jgi:hypothetical protein
MLQIYRIIKKRGLKQTEAARILGVRQPEVSGLMRGYSGAYSVERLMTFLTGKLDVQSQQDSPIPCCGCGYLDVAPSREISDSAVSTS